ncbi:MAG: ABC transporter permease, partial [Ectothiorhodospiraceae bacterium]
MSRPTTLTWAWRQSWSMRYRLLGIAVILGMSYGMFVGVYSAIRSLYDTRDHYYDVLNVADLEAEVIPADLANVPPLDDVPGVEDYAARLVSPGQLTLPNDERYATTVVTRDLDRDSGIDRLQILDGKPLSPDDPDAVLVDRNFARYHDLHPGDSLHMEMGNAAYDLTVAGIALSPEHLIAPANPNFFLPVKGSVGVVWAPQRLIARRMNFALVNSIVVTYRDGADPAATRQAVRDRLASRLAVESVTPLERQFSHLFMQVDLNAFSIFIPAVIVVFVLATISVGLFLIVRWVAAQKPTLGVLMALGFRKPRLIAAQLVPNVVMALTAIVLGIPIAYL